MQRTISEENKGFSEETGGNAYRGLRQFSYFFIAN
jgi:hypothetical protein